MYFESKIFGCLRLLNIITVKLFLLYIYLRKSSPALFVIITIITMQKVKKARLNVKLRNGKGEAEKPIE